MNAEYSCSANDSSCALARSAGEGSAGFCSDQAKCVKRAIEVAVGRYKGRESAAVK